MIIDYLRQSIFFFRSNIVTLAKINLPFLVIFNVIFMQMDTSLSEASRESFTNTMLMISGLNLLIMPIYWGATIKFMQSTLNGPQYTASQAIMSSLQLWPKLFMVFFMTSVCMFFGFMALIIPGIYIAIRLSLADYICVVEKKAAIESLKLSWEHSAKYIWPIFLGILAILVGILVIKAITFSLLASISNELLFLEPVLNTAFDFLNILIMIYGFRIFCLIKDEL